MLFKHSLLHNYRKTYYLNFNRVEWYLHVPIMYNLITLVNTSGHAMWTKNRNLLLKLGQEIVIFPGVSYLYAVRSEKLCDILIMICIHLITEWKLCRVNQRTLRLFVSPSSKGDLPRTNFD